MVWSPIRRCSVVWTMSICLPISNNELSEYRQHQNYDHYDHYHHRHRQGHHQHRHHLFTCDYGVNSGVSLA